MVTQVKTDNIDDLLYQISLLNKEIKGKCHQIDKLITRIEIVQEYELVQKD